MAKDSSSPAEALARRKEATDFINGNNMLSVGATPKNELAKTKSESTKEDEVEDRKKHDLRREGDEEKRNSSRKKNSLKRRVAKKTQDVVVEHPAVQRALLKSRTQKTLRFPPLLIVEYEETCRKLGIEPEFNNHMNEALEIWLQQSKKRES